MRDRTSLEIAEVVGRVVHQLHMPDAAPMRRLQPFKLHFEEVEPLHIGDDRRLARLARRFEIGGAQRTARAVTGDQIVHPGEAVDVVAVELAWFRRADRGQRAFGSAAEHGPVRHVGQAGHRQRSRPHRVGEIVARRHLRDDPGFAAVAMDIDRDGVAQDGECGRGGLGGPRRFRRTAVQPRRRASPRPRPAACFPSRDA